MSVTISEILHASLVIKDVATSRRFYEDILQLEVDESRPDLGYPGLWLNVGQQQLHLLQVPNPDPTENRPEHGGRDRHLALAVQDILWLQDKLEQENIPFTRSRSGRAALFCRDPDGNALEFIEIS